MTNVEVVDQSKEFYNCLIEKTMKHFLRELWASKITFTDQLGVNTDGRNDSRIYVQVPISNTLMRKNETVLNLTLVFSLTKREGYHYLSYATTLTIVGHTGVQQRKVLRILSNQLKGIDSARKEKLYSLSDIEDMVVTAKYELQRMLKEINNSKNFYITSVHYPFGGEDSLVETHLNLFNKVLGYGCYSYIVDKSLISVSVSYDDFTIAVSPFVTTKEVYDFTTPDTLKDVLYILFYSDEHCGKKYMETNLRSSGFSSNAEVMAWFEQFLTARELLKSEVIDKSNGVKC